MATPKDPFVRVEESPSPAEDLSVKTAREITDTTPQYIGVWLTVIGYSPGPLPTKPKTLHLEILAPSILPPNPEPIKSQSCGRGRRERSSRPSLKVQTMTQTRTRPHQATAAARNNTGRTRRRNMALRTIHLFATPAVSTCHGSSNVRSVRSSGVAIATERPRALARPPRSRRNARGLGSGRARRKRESSIGERIYQAGR